MDNERGRRMIIPKHKVCDICEKPVGVNRRYYIIKSKCFYQGYGGGAKDNKTHHICEDCMYKITDAIREQLRDDEDNDLDELEVT